MLAADEKETRERGERHFGKINPQSCVFFRVDPSFSGEKAEFLKAVSILAEDLFFVNSEQKATSSGEKVAETKP